MTQIPLWSSVPTMKTSCATRSVRVKILVLNMLGLFIEDLGAVLCRRRW
jgi:hypothetical protein